MSNQNKLLSDDRTELSKERGGGGRIVLWIGIEVYWHANGAMGWQH